MRVWDLAVGKISDAILYSPSIKRLAVKAMKSPMIVGNPVYSYVYRKQIMKLMKICQEKPLHVMIENTNACNYRCSFCPHNVMKRQIGFMTMELYKKIIDECVHLGIEHIDIHQFGEPLLDPNFAERVVYAKRAGIKFVTTNSNGFLLAEGLAKKLVEAGLDQIIISLDAATEETYRKVRASGKLEIVERNIKGLIKIGNSIESSRPTVVVDFVQQPENRHEVKLFVKKWRGVADKVMMSYMHDWAGSADKQPFELHGNPSREPCRLLWSDMVVAWDGRVMLCCVDYEGEVTLGDLKNQNLKEIWKGEKLRKVRETHLKGEFQKTPLCDRCTYRTTWWISK
jgi:radical SAM protein with 4Fe4S-binding SPASM domain